MICSESDLAALLPLCGDIATARALALWLGWDVVEG